jgi:hypothetical protein
MIATRRNVTIGHDDLVSGSPARGRFSVFMGTSAISVKRGERVFQVDVFALNALDGCFGRRVDLGFGRYRLLPLLVAVQRVAVVLPNGVRHVVAGECSTGAHFVKAAFHS